MLGSSERQGGSAASFEPLTAWCEAQDVSAHIPDNTRLMKNYAKVWNLMLAETSSGNHQEASELMGQLRAIEAELPSPSPGTRQK